MSVRYALRISVDDATEETPSAAYRSGSPEAVESGAAGIVAEAVLDERSRQKARGMCRRRASGRGCGGRIRGRTFRTEGRVAGVVAVVRDARRRVRRVRRSDTTRRDATMGRRRRGKRRRKIGGEPAKRLDRERPDRADRKGTDAFHRLFGSTGCRYEIPFLFWRGLRGATKSAGGKPTAVARARTTSRRPARARASDPHHGVPRQHR